MTYKECLEFLYSQLPMYQRVGQAAYKADLNSTIALCDLLNNPQKSFRSIHIAGTNGKGSVSNMLASVFQENGYKTGLYTSPHLKDFRERIRINGEMIPQKYVIDFVEAHRDAVIEISPSFFEWTVALAFQYFREEEVDIALLETGMGGRLDSTNVVTPEVSVITNIGMDHMQFLGNTLAEIAREKAGIIKPGVPVVVGTVTDETLPVFKSASEKIGSEFLIASELDFPIPESDLLGPFQRENLKTVLQVLEILREKGWKMEDDSILSGLKNVRKNTGIRGRWEWLSEDPRILTDMAHNEQGVKILVKGLGDQKFNKLHMVWGMVSDKDVTNILKVLPKNAIYYFCKPDIPRGMEAEKLRGEAEKSGLSGKAFPTVNEALEAAKSSCGRDDLIFVGGSSFVVAEVV